jgi:hypothetical protein
MNWYRLAQQRYLWDNDPDLPVANASSREEYWDLKYPRAGQSVSGLTVGDRVDNTSSIGASLESYYVYPDIREVPMSDFSGGGYATSDDFRRSRALIEQIRGSGLINPLIVAIDEKGPYILEGGHRFDALREMGVPSFPALVVLETVENGTLQRQGQAKLAATARQLMSIGVEVVNGKAILYRGTNISGLTADDLRYGDFLSSVPSGTDVTGNAGADSYGKYVERYEIPVEYVEISNGELQYKGPSKSLSGGGKYPEAIYRAYNDAQGSNSTAAEIDKESDFYVRQVAGMALPGGKEEFDKLLQQHRGGGSTKQAQQQFNTGDKFEMGDIVELPFQEGHPAPKKPNR